MDKYTVNCGKCGGKHEIAMGEELKPFVNPLKDRDGNVWTHYFFCPIEGQIVWWRVENAST